MYTLEGTDAYFESHQKDDAYRHVEDDERLVEEIANLEGIENPSTVSEP